jgi:hypothetical protein
MKPLHVGLLVVGAALAGGLAVKMTQLPPLPVPKPVRVPVPVAAKQSPAAEPSVPVKKQSAEAVSGEAVSSIPPTPAPPPVYEEPPHVTVSAGRTPARQHVQTPAKKPVQTASLAANRAPTKVAQTASPAHAMPLPLPYQEPPPVAPETPPLSAPAPEPEKQQAEQLEEPAPPPLHQVTLRPGTQVSVRLIQTLSTDHLVAGDTFEATLAQPIIVDGLVIAEKGARASGRVVESRKAGRFSGTSLLELTLASLYTADGQRIAVSTSPWSRQSASETGGDAAKIGGGAALGAIIGAIAGGGTGAAIGAGVGGGVGVGAAAATGGKPVKIPSETIIRFRLTSGVTITERRM